MKDVLESIEVNVIIVIFLLVYFILSIILISVLGIDFIIQGNIKNENLKESEQSKKQIIIASVVLILFTVIYTWFMESILENKYLFHILLSVTIAVFIVISVLGVFKNRKKNELPNQDFTPVLVTKTLTLLMVIGVIGFSIYIVASTINGNNRMDSTITYLETQVAITIMIMAIFSGICVFVYNLLSILLIGERYVKVCLESLGMFGQIETFISLIGLGYAIFGVKADFEAPEKSILILSFLLLAMIIFDKMYWKIYLWIWPIETKEEQRLKKLEDQIEILKEQMNNLKDHS